MSKIDGGAAEGEVEGHAGFWIRGHLIELPASEDETVVGGINAAAQILTEGVAAESALACLSGDIYVPLDQSRTFFPFGEQPALDTCFYLLSEEIDWPTVEAGKLEKVYVPENINAGSVLEDLPLVPYHSIGLDDNEQYFGAF